MPRVVSLGIGLEYRFRSASAKREPTGRRPGASVKPRRERSEQGAERETTSGNSRQVSDLAAIVFLV